MYLLRLAAKNVRRKTWRSLLTAIPVWVGVHMIIIGWSFIDGIDNAVLIGQIKSDSGHFRIVAEGYFEREEDLEIDHLVDGAAEVREAFTTDGVVLLERLSFSGELSDGRQGLRARGLGVDPESYFSELVLPLEAHLDDAGVDPDLEPMWLGASLAQDFGVVPGDTLTVLARTRYGSYNADEYQVRGLVRSLNPAVDGFAFFIPLEAARQLLDAEGAASELVGFAPSRDAALELPERFAPELRTRGLEIETWLERAEPILRINRIRRRILAFVIGIVVLVAAAGIANTVVMAAFERRQEIGALRALGMGVGAVVVLFLGEALLIGGLGSAVGCLSGTGLVRALADGIDLSKVFSSGGYTMSISMVLYLELDSRHTAAAFAIGLGMTLLAALYPALKFSRLPPVEAMRT